MSTLDVDKLVDYIDREYIKKGAAMVSEISTENTNIIQCRLYALSSIVIPIDMAKYSIGDKSLKTDGTNVFNVPWGLLITTLHKHITELQTETIISQKDYKEDSTNDVNHILFYMYRMSVTPEYIFYNLDLILKNPPSNIIEESHRLRDLYCINMGSFEFRQLFQTRLNLYFNDEKNTIDFFTIFKRYSSGPFNWLISTLILVEDDEKFFRQVSICSSLNDPLSILDEKTENLPSNIPKKLRILNGNRCSDNTNNARDISELENITDTCEMLSVRYDFLFNRSEFSKKSKEWVVAKTGKLPVYLEERPYFLPSNLMMPFKTLTMSGVIMKGLRRIFGA